MERLSWQGNNSMNDTLQDGKRNLRKFLGKSGIHALGVSMANRSIRVYVSDGADPLTKVHPLFREMQECVAPFSLEIVYRQRAMAL